MKFFFHIVLFSFFCLILLSCNKNVEDSSELYKDSQTVGDIVDRSGTILRAGSNKGDLERQLNDAQNRLRTGGGLLGKKPQEIFQFGETGQQSVTSIGFPINPYLWKGTLETISFMSLASADPFAGIIITDWYTDQNDINNRCKLNIFIKGAELKTNNLKVNSFCQILTENGSWVDQKVKVENNIKLENAILNKAKKIKLSQS